MNQAEDYSSSPYPCNALANARTRRVVAELNQWAPDFVVHLGDIVNPVPELPTYGEAAEHFKRLIEALDAPIHLVPGNHDVGDKPVSWMPAGRVNDGHIALYEAHFGSHYYSFDYRNLHFIILNTPIINSGLASEHEQKRWFEADLKASKEKRTVLCLHYPPYVSNPDESGSYDNIDEPGRSWLLDLIDEYQPEMVFCGHVHNFWYDRRNQTEIFLLPSTAFVRHDYSEFFRIEPGDQFGRNDEPKLGYFIVRVYEDGQVIENIRTYGRTLAEGEELPPAPAAVNNVQSRESNIESIGIDMRHPWAEEMEIAPSGAVDEFERKIARNDYPILGMWEMGIRKMRVPIQDICTPKTRARMRILKSIGHLFHVYTYGLPSVDQQRALLENADLLDVLEVVASWESANTMLETLARIKAETGAEIYLSRVNRKDAQKFEGTRFNHLISHGFVFAETKDIAEFVAEHDPQATVDGFMFRIKREVFPGDAAVEAKSFFDQHGRKACLYVRTPGSSPAEGFQNDADNGSRIAESIVAAVAFGEGVSVILDTYADVDRGYFARSGLVDRRYNPRSTSHIAKSLIGLLQAGPWRFDSSTTIDAYDVRVLSVHNDQGDRIDLILPKVTDVSLHQVISAPSSHALSINLITGIANAVGDLLNTSLTGPVVVFQACKETREKVIRLSVGTGGNIIRESA